MVRISIDYGGDFHCRVTHGPSGRSFETDAPKDNEGRGESFSPTDLVATALGSCLATTMAIVCRRKGVELEHFSVTVDKEMTAEGPRKISRLTTHVYLPFSRTPEIGPLLERTAESCPVFLSLNESVEKSVRFHWATRQPED